MSERVSDFTRRTLRTWAVLDAAHGLVLGGVAAGLIPWKTPAANGALLVYAGLHLAAAIGLWKGARWGWRLGLAAGVVGLAAGALVIGGMLTSWAYLHGIYGDFGYGASIVCLLFAAVAFGVLGLFPAIQLRALLRREVRADFGRAVAVRAAVAGLLVVPPLVAAVVHVRHALTPLEPVPEAGRIQAVRVLRAALLGEPRPETPALEGVPVGAGPLYVTLWHRGRAVARVTGDGPDLATAVDRAADALTGHPRLAGRRTREGRLKIDRIVAVGPVLSDALPVLALSVNPGLDGLRRIGDGAERVLLPDDLVRHDVFGHAPLVPGIKELRLGLDAAWALKRLGGPGGDLERLRAESWVEHDDGALPVVRANTPGPDPSPESFRAAAIAGGDFVLRQIRRDGRFHYLYYALDNRHPRSREYSLPRHAGTVYSLALLYRLTKLERFREGAARAAEWLVKRIPERCGRTGLACVASGSRASLGSSALTLVGMLEYQRSTGDARFKDAARRLADFIVSQQRPDGEFHHLFDLRKQRPDPTYRSMFYSEEAALALVMAHEVLGDDRYLAAAERALDYLTGPKYDFFIGRFIWGADHWTCIAAEEAWPRLKHRRYLDFCLGYARFIRRLQYEPEGWDNADFRGHYGFSGLMVPQAPAAAGFTEATISTWLLSKHHGEPAEDVRAQTHAALAALLRDQVRDDNAWLARSPERARGGIRRSLVQQDVRIDFTQHALSALIRGAGI